MKKLSIFIIALGLLLLITSLANAQIRGITKGGDWFVTLSEQDARQAYKLLQRKRNGKYAKALAEQRFMGTLPGGVPVHLGERIFDPPITMVLVLKSQRWIWVADKAIDWDPAIWPYGDPGGRGSWPK